MLYQVYYLIMMMFLVPYPYMLSLLKGENDPRVLILMINPRVIDKGENDPCVLISMANPRV